MVTFLLEQCADELEQVKIWEEALENYLNTVDNKFTIINIESLRGIAKRVNCLDFFTLSFRVLKNVLQILVGLNLVWNIDNSSVLLLGVCQ